MGATLSDQVKPNEGRYHLDLHFAGYGEPHWSVRVQVQTRSE